MMKKIITTLLVCGVFLKILYACTTMTYLPSTPERVINSDTIYVGYHRNYKIQSFARHDTVYHTTPCYRHLYMYIKQDTMSYTSKPTLSFFECKMKIHPPYETKKVKSKWLKKQPIINEMYFEKYGFREMIKWDYMGKVYYIFQYPIDKKQEWIEIKEVGFSTTKEDFE